MVGRIILTAVLTNPDGVFEDEMPVEYPPQDTKTVVFQALGVINKVGGLIRPLADDHIEFIPMIRVKSLDLKLSTIVGANFQDAATLPPPPGAGLVSR